MTRPDHDAAPMHRRPTMTGMWDDRQPGRHLALSVVHPSSPTLRVRYRQGVLIGPYGYPDWLVCARTVVELPEPDPKLTVDEIRVLDVLAANAAMARTAAAPDGDPLWSASVGGVSHDAIATPAGWCWAHAGPVHAASADPPARRLALVPMELHGAFRHAGGVGLLPATGRGLRQEGVTAPVGVGTVDRVPADVVAQAERLLRAPLPSAYRRFLAATNGAGPAAPAVSPPFGFIADQPLFGLARPDPHQDLPYAAAWLRDRFAPDLLPIGYVQGGLLAVKVAGDDLDSIWYWDDDDPRDREAFDARHICTNLLHRCADSIDQLWARLVPPPNWLIQYAHFWVDHGMVRQVRDPALGAALPAVSRAPLASPGLVTRRDSMAALFEAV
jgi:A nuclease of the HNH/ENDO VII superfamily with conserved WHH/SMI1 / KNR4 family (SUKH-1)